MNPFSFDGVRAALGYKPQACTECGVDLVPGESFQCSPCGQRKHPAAKCEGCGEVNQVVEMFEGNCRDCVPVMACDCCGELESKDEISHFLESSCGETFACRKCCERAS